MLSNKHLSKSIPDAGWSHFFELLYDKAAEAVRTVTKVELHGTSQICSCDKQVSTILNVRVHRCPSCHSELDCNLNTATFRHSLKRIKYYFSLLNLWHKLLKIGGARRYFKMIEIYQNVMRY